MKAVILTKPTKSSEIQLSDCDIPKVKPGWVLVHIKAFGMNHSEQILRKAEISAPYIQKPVIPGIECVGEIADASDTDFPVGQKVIALMGGMGREFDGSYAEYALLPAHHVFAVNSDLAWDQLAAIPETYFTAWGSLFECLSLKSSDHLLIRGGTCALGYAAISIATALGCKVTATTHKESKLPLLAECGAAVSLHDNGFLTGRISGVTKALELVGIKTLKDTLSCMDNGGIVCNTGNLGGVYTWNGFDPIKDIPNGVYLTGFFSNTPTQTVINDLFTFLNTHNMIPHIGKQYRFSDIAKACEDMDSGKVNGKIVIVVDGH